MKKHTFAFESKKYVKVLNDDPKKISFKTQTITSIKKLTLCELIQSFECKKFFFSDPYGYVSTKLTTYKEFLSRLNEKPNAYYLVDVSGAKMTVFPKVKTKQEINEFSKNVSSLPLD